MPDIITHYRYAQSVLSRLQEDVRETISPGMYNLACVGPDLWFSYAFWSKKKQNGLPNRGSLMHRKGTGKYLMTMLRICKEAEPEAQKELFSYFAGYICHYTLDREAHPYIIYRTGNYLGTKETLPYRGNHMYMERAIDTEMLKVWPDAGKNPILNKILAMKKMPECVRADYDRLHRETYGWDAAYADMNQCICHQRLFYRLAWDPHGVLMPILRLADNGVSQNDLTACTYYGKDRRNLDVLNTAHREWKHPWDSSLASTASFEDLRLRASDNAVSIIGKAWAFLHGESNDVEEAIGNFSYESGFACDDPRNDAAPSCDPLPLKSAE